MAALALVVDGVIVRRFEVEGQELTIGRHPGNDIHIEDAAVSSRHARLFARPSRYLAGQVELYIEDLGSTNGTFVNGVKCRRQQLTNEDEVRIAWNSFKFIDDSETGLERTAVILETS